MKLTRNDYDDRRVLLGARYVVMRGIGPTKAWEIVQVICFVRGIPWVRVERLSSRARKKSTCIPITFLSRRTEPLKPEER